MSPKLGHLVGAAAGAAFLLAAVLRYRRRAMAQERAAPGDAASEQGDEHEQEEPPWRRQSLPRKLESMMASKLAAFRWREQLRRVHKQTVVLSSSAPPTVSDDISTSSPGTPATLRRKNFEREQISFEHTGFENRGHVKQPAQEKVKAFGHLLLPASVLNFRVVD